MELQSTFKNRNAMCLTEDQTRYIYKKVEQGSNLNTETMKQEIEQEKMTEMKPSEENEANPYQKVVLNNVHKDKIKTEQMENWSILSDNVKYIQHDEGSKTTHNLDVKTLAYRQHKKLYHSVKGEESQMLDIHFESNPGIMRSNYLDMYGGIHADVVCTNRFDESSDLSMTYLGKTKMTRERKVKAEEKFPILGQGYTLGKLLDNTDCQILLATGESKSYMSRSSSLRCSTLHGLPHICFQYTENTGRK